MKISIIGPGFMSIPPIGWGAVESLIWDYSENLKKHGHDVQIVNKLLIKLIVLILILFIYNTMTTHT